MIKFICKISTLTLLVFLPSLTLGQQGPVQTKPIIYVLEFEDSGASRDNISDFAEQLVILRLRQLKTYTSDKRSRDKEPPCDREPQTTVNSSQQRTIGSDAKYYAVRASIRVHEPENAPAEAVLDYELVKCRNLGVRVALAKNNRTFPYADILAYLNSMAETISFILVQEQEVTKTTVAFRGVTGPSHAATLGQQVFTRLVEAQEFEPQNVNSPTPQPAAEYTLSGRVFVSNSKLWFAVEVRKGRQSFKKIFEGPKESDLSDPAKLENFYKEASFLALDYLTLIRNVADTEQPPPSDAEAQTSLKQARELLCKIEPLPAGCVPQASPAADLLTEVVRNKKFDTFEVWASLGEALFQSGENNRAGLAFDSAAVLASQASKDSDAADFLRKGGEAYHAAGNFAAAASIYDRLLQLAPSRADAYLGKARAHRYNNERGRALNILLTGIASLPDSKELKEELEFLIGSWPKAEIDSAIKVINSRTETSAVSLARVLLQRRQAELILYDVVGHWERTQYERMDAELKKVENLQDLLPPDSDEKLATLMFRGLWRREARGEFDAALGVLKEVKRKLSERGEKNVGLLDMEIGNTIFKRGLARVDKTLARQDFEEAASFLTIAAKKGSEESSNLSLLREINHQLGKDKDTRELLQGLVAQGSMDLDTSLNLGFVCNSYFGDLECGMAAANRIGSLADYRSTSFSLLLRADVLTLKGDYDAALTALKDMAIGVSPPAALTIGQFYDLLLQVLKKKQFEVSDSVKWQSSMRHARESATEIEWVFDGVLRVVDADPSIDANTKKLLHDMVSAMLDRKKPLPELPSKGP